jgi:hypothetical protein
MCMLGIGWYNFFYRYWYFLVHPLRQNILSIVNHQSSFCILSHEYFFCKLVVTSNIVLCNLTSNPSLGTKLKVYNSIPKVSLLQICTQLSWNSYRYWKSNCCGYQYLLVSQLPAGTGIRYENRSILSVCKSDWTSVTQRFIFEVQMHVETFWLSKTEEEGQVKIIWLFKTLAFLSRSTWKPSKLIIDGHEFLQYLFSLVKLDQHKQA